MHQNLLSWVFLLGFCLALASPAQAQASAPGRIVLARVAGQVTLTPKDTGIATAAVANATITAGTIVTTGKGGSVILVFSNGSTINLREDSVLDIETFLQDPFEAMDLKVADMTAEPSASTTKLNLTRGELVGNVKKLDTAKGSTFEVTTPVGAAGIRGTTFRIVFRPDPANPNRMLFSVSTAEGLIDVQMQGGAEGAVPVADGREVVVEVNVSVDPITGAITVTTPPQIVTQDIPASTQQIIMSATQEVLSAVPNMVVPQASSGSPPAETPPTGEGEGNPPEPTTLAIAKQIAEPPPPVAPPPATTPGAGL
ncbi:MAG TPA: FecR family protein [Opitutaceae bacterium]